MWRIECGDVEGMLGTIPDGSIQCVVTSPPYWGLRDYGVAGQMGVEATPEEYVAKMVRVFREVRRVLRPDGTLWLNMGDSYAHSGPCGGSSPDGPRKPRATDRVAQEQMGYRVPPGLKPKDLVGMPWLVAFALRADGWWLRSDIIWAKPNPMPESVTDRPTKSHEYLFLLSKSATYYYDTEAVREDSVCEESCRPRSPRSPAKQEGDPLFRTRVGAHANYKVYPRRNRRTIWTIPSQPFKGAHFATFPEKLVEPCILAGTKAGDTVLDPFCGSGTTGVVALRLGRDFIGIDLKAEYVEMARDRITKVPSPLFV